MELLSVQISDFDEKIRNSIEICATKWNLKMFRESNISTAPLVLAYQSTSLEVEKNWLQVVSDVALSIQANLQLELARRNMTMMFVSSGRLSVAILKEIRENTYCCKKIVIESQQNCEEAVRSYYLSGHISPNAASVEVSSDGNLEKIILDKYSLINKIFERS